MKDKKIRKWLRKYARENVNEAVKGTRLLDRIAIAFSVVFFRRIKNG